MIIDQHQYLFFLLTSLQQLSIMSTMKHGIGGIADAFSSAKQTGRATLIPYICGGYDSPAKTVGLLLAMQKGGADIIELGIPSPNPFADGDTIKIKESHKIAIDNGTAGMSRQYFGDSKGKGFDRPSNFDGILLRHASRI